MRIADEPGVTEVPTTTLADMLIERLLAWDVDTIFGFPGDGINGIFEALRTHEGRMRFVQVKILKNVAKNEIRELV